MVLPIDKQICPTIMFRPTYSLTGLKCNTAEGGGAPFPFLPLSYFFKYTLKHTDTTLCRER